MTRIPVLSGRLQTRSGYRVLPSPNMVFSNFNTTLMGVGHAEPTALMAELLFENVYKRSYQPPLSPGLGGPP